VPATTRTAGQGSRISALASGSPEEIARVGTRDRRIEQLLQQEWLLTNKWGSFSSSTIVGCHTRSYHGLLIGSPDPLVRRLMTLSNCVEQVRWNGGSADLSTFEFPDRLAPVGYVHLEEFRRDIGAHFRFRTEPVDLCKSVYLARDSDTVAIEYMFREVRTPVDFLVRPLVGMRDLHLLQRSDASLACRMVAGGAAIRNGEAADGELWLGAEGLAFQSDPQWWFNFVYRVNAGRGQAHTEDLWAPGVFQAQIDRPRRVVFWARLGGGGAPELMTPVDVDALHGDLLSHQERLLERAGATGKTHRILCLAADQFVARRRTHDGERATIVAGFPWFADWGRATCIALPGLLLTTGRREEAAGVLGTFAAAADQGMIPNRFDDRTGEAQFNSVDASLWFIHAAFAYLEAGGDAGWFARHLLPVIRSIIDAYHAGTRHGIHADADGLITAGDPHTQLTWMDARYDGIALTPRHGKAVEINALWHNALRLMQKYCERHVPAEAAGYAALVMQVGANFSKVFWNPQRGYLNDTVLPDGTVDASLRPNQLFALSLPFGPPLTRPQRWAILNAVEQRLWTPYGLRTLSSGDPAYRGRYEGTLRQRDEAYHQGTVWPYLMGAFLEAHLRTQGHSAAARSNAAELMRPLLHHLVEDGCLGSISEVFDGDPPHRSDGCGAQAWSVGELLRLYRMTLPE
jgi:predicted glycogen debranching enzyme